MPTYSKCVSLRSADGKKGCQMVYFQTKNTTLGNFLDCLAIKEFGKFWSVLQLKNLVNFIAISYILMLFGIFCSQFGIFFQFWYVVPRKIWQS
jgi:hypothetical protein